MGKRRRGCAWGIMFILVACFSHASAEGDPLVATVDQPVVVSAIEAAAPRPAGESPHVVLSVIGYRPPEDGAVQGIVKVINSESKTVQEIGRFGISPDVEFRVADPSRAPRFYFPLPKDRKGDA